MSGTPTARASARPAPSGFVDPRACGLRPDEVVSMRVLDTEDGGWDAGGRMDLMYGTDYIWTTAAGLDAYNYNHYNYTKTRFGYYILDLLL